MHEVAVHFITFNNTRFHLNSAMEEWCRENIGPGTWVGGRLKTWDDMEPNTWVIESVFGNTTFTFKDPEQLTLFLLVWA